MQGILVLVAVLVLASAFGVLLRRSGRRLASAAAEPPEHRLEVLGPAELGVPLGSRATLVQISSAFCAPCRATRRVLDQVSNQVEGVAHVEIDAESHLQLVRRLDVRRTPTVLVLDSTGRVVRRASGQPRHADVVAALGAAVGA